MLTIKDVQVLVPDETTVVLRCGEKGGQFAFSARLTAEEFYALGSHVDDEIAKKIETAARAD